MSSLSARVGDDPSDSTTDGWVFSSKKGSRSTSVNGRSTRRGVVTTTPGTSGHSGHPGPSRHARAYAPSAFTAVSAAQR